MAVPLTEAIPYVSDTPVASAGVPNLGSVQVCYHKENPLSELLRVWVYIGN